MEFLGNIFNTILYQPLLSALLLLRQYLPGQDLGVAVIALTVIIKLFLYPLGAKGIKSQKALQDLQPKIKEIQNKFKNDKARQAQETMDLYKREKINPFSSLGLLLVQFPILIALFRVFSRGINEMNGVSTDFLGILDLSQPSVILAVVCGLAQFWQAKMLTPVRNTSHSNAGGPGQNKQDFSGMMQKQMIYFMPLFTVFILWRFPSAMALYWLVTTLFTIGQQYITLRKNKNVSI